MNKREAFIVVSLMTMLYIAAFAGGYRSARAKLDVLLEQGCRMRCTQTIIVPPDGAKPNNGNVIPPLPYKGPSSRI